MYIICAAAMLQVSVIINNHHLDAPNPLVFEVFFPALFLLLLSSLQDRIPPEYARPPLRPLLTFSVACQSLLVFVFS